jgi:hypothetical protein
MLSLRELRCQLCELCSGVSSYVSTGDTRPQLFWLVEKRSKCRQILRLIDLGVLDLVCLMDSRCEVGMDHNASHVGDHQ